MRCLKSISSDFTNDRSHTHCIYSDSSSCFSFFGSKALSSLLPSVSGSEGGKAARPRLTRFTLHVEKTRRRDERSSTHSQPFGSF